MRLSGILGGWVMNFETATLESMCELVVDCPHSTPEWTESGIIVLRNQNIRDGELDLSSPSYTNEEGYKSRIKRAVPQAGDIVFTRETPMGEVCIIPPGIKCCLGQRQVLLRPKKSIHGEYLYWALQSPFVQHQISWNEGTGSTVSNVRIPVLKALEIPRPSLAEQRAIAEVLGALDDKIELNRQTNQTLEALAQRLFKSWFVDFDPVNAKLAGRTPAHMDVETAALFPDRLVESKLGLIPEGWTPATLAELVEINPREKLKKGLLTPYVEMAVLPTQGMCIEGLREREFTSGSKFRFGDTLLARITPCLENGKAALFMELSAEQVAWGSTEFIVMRPREGVPVLWPYLLARNAAFREYAIQHMAGTSGRQRVAPQSIAQYPLAVPSQEVLKA